MARTAAPRSLVSVAAGGLAAAAIAGATSFAAAQVPTGTPRTPAEATLLPFTKYTLANGITVVFHEDHAVPLVAVNVMYKVGSRNEAPKRTGFAHMFEHLMFMGTKRA